MSKLKVFRRSISYRLSLLILGIFSVIHPVFSADVDINDLFEKINDIKQRNNVSAAIVMVVDKNGVVINRKLGVSSWQGGQPLSDDQMFRIGSISKSFAGLLALRMQQAAVIDLKKPINHYLKTSPIDNLYPERQITLEQLLEHTAGLPDLSRKEWDYNDSKPINIEQALALRESRHKTRWPSGLYSSYSNLDTGILGLVLEKASGKSYEDLMQTYVFEPLSMKSSTLLLEPHVKKRLMKGYNTDGKTLIPYWHNVYRPFAAINIDDQDMVQFLQMMLNHGNSSRGQFLTKQDIKRMQSPQTTIAAGSGLTYGYGLANYHWQFNGHTFHGHGGDADGYLSRYGYNRESGLAYFVMINAFQGQTLKRIRNLVEAYVVKDLPKPKYPKRLQLNDETLTQYVGQYTAATSRFSKLSGSTTQMKIFLNDGQLFRQLGTGRAHAIYAVTDQHFRHDDESIATMSFSEYGGKYHLQGDFGNYIKL